ncbi:MAG: hypothetical protein P8N73_11460 [Pseudomonadales bacterium]|nr:hypothetical protein [Gammaproteobacteria bacterium]MDG1125483.1 hypothetical protein [Pseudomonadales bacterium]
MKCASPTGEISPFVVLHPVSLSIDISMDTSVGTSIDTRLDNSAEGSN